MAQFHYTALTQDGQRVQGALEADSEAAVLRQLEERRLFPVAVRGQQGLLPSRARWRRRVRTRELAMMYGQLADLLGSGVPLLRALDCLINSTPGQVLREVLREVRARVADGRSLTESLREFPDVFPALHTAMVQAGERAAFLDQVLRGLSDFLERLDELRVKVVGALIYPALLTVLGITVMLGALVLFVPKFEPLLAHTPKPWPTRILFAASHTVRTYGWLVGLGVVGLAALGWTSLKTQRARRLLERWRLRLPVVGSALRLLAITRFCRILGTMLAHGVPLLQALRISKDATGSALLAERIAQATDAVRDGKRLSEPLAAGGFFPEQILAMITVAEESNKLDQVLLQIADTVERRTNRQVDQAVRLIEPVILCGVAACIGFLALGLLLPIFTLAGSLGKR
jgi:general secretion pathway protein F/type IV pilus assembly protein PilC